jgi:hypothetical protein
VVGDGVSYANGSSYIALQTNTGIEPDLNPTYWGQLAAAGASGPAGVAGPTGAQGAAGAAATVAIGTVTTGEAGSFAAVTNSGSSSAAVLNFTIPQGAAGSGGSGGTSGIPFAVISHVEPSGGTPGTTPEYYSVNTSTASAIESASLLTWVPAGCTVTALNVYSQLTASTTLTLRTFATLPSTGVTLLTCTVAAGPSSTTCTVPSGTQVPAGFIDYKITTENGPASPTIWTALACN